MASAPRAIYKLTGKLGPPVRQLKWREPVAALADYPAAFFDAIRPGDFRMRMTHPKLVRSQQIWHYSCKIRGSRPCSTRYRHLIADALWSRSKR